MRAARLQLDFATRRRTPHQLDGEGQALAGECVAGGEGAHLDSGEIAKRMQQRGSDQTRNEKRDAETER